MVKAIYSIFDRKAGFFRYHFFAVSDGMAARSVQSACEQGSELSRYPEDFTLYKIGEINETSGEIKSINPPEIITQVVALVNIINTNKEGKDEGQDKQA